MSDKIQVIDDHHDLSISYKWMSPKAYFLFFFSIMWNGFLLFWYSMTFIGGAPLIALLFPLIHVVIGVGLGYYSLALFLNKTTLNVSGDNLKIKHSPLPWLGNNLNLDVNDLEQLYVKEYKKSREGNTYYSYELRGKVVGGKDIKVLGLQDMESFEAKELERKIEDFLGIQDYRVAGEFEGDMKKTIDEVPRKTPKRLQAANMGLEDLTVGCILDYEEHTYEVKHSFQYDWVNGNSDKLLQLVDYQSDEQLLYLHQNKGILTPFLEVELGLAEARNIVFDAADAPSDISYQDGTFTLHSYHKGKVFSSSNRASLPLEQWIYRNNDNFQIRIVRQQNMDSFYFGKKEMDVSFSNFYTT